ncbi:hypothetical protein MMJ61_04675 [Enterococcus cecorum]|uniref:hypothetical protein n=1 Tax=Enterococcus cecorum TaxID=44008 RepID=UPI001FABEAD7|nr:hypothetical protein [Enterococcus cecorum]MCJ0571497.1 hypothetical protein [Enterococcus cecorum]MCJ0578565.1 hypothetical protein [Enterococcus cecorum]MCJ0583166.1 hypothetical protein [Enterococcus cecorum]MCJ0585853.1 hypothetical protein [Enterococcus cecorum]MCJ0588199.1 hypothetical protein [Enterococcus cecorum]
MKEMIRNRNAIVEYGLHDSRIKKITLVDDHLVFTVDKVFYYSKSGEEQGFEAEVIFTRCHLEDCWVLVYDGVLSEEKFSGQRIAMQDFIQQYDHQEFEIISELHNGYSTFFVGWLWKNQIPVSAQVEIFNFGEMIIRIGQQVF